MRYLLYFLKGIEIYIRHEWASKSIEMDETILLSR